MGTHRSRADCSRCLWFSLTRALSRSRSLAYLLSVPLPCSAGTCKTTTSQAYRWGFSITRRVSLPCKLRNLAPGENGGVIFVGFPRGHEPRFCGGANLASTGRHIGAQGTCAGPEEHPCWAAAFLWLGKVGASTGRLTARGSPTVDACTPLPHMCAPQVPGRQPAEGNPGATFCRATPTWHHRRPKRGPPRLRA